MKLFKATVPPIVTFSKDRKFTPEGHAIFVCDQYGTGPIKLPGILGVALHGKWDVEKADFPEREEYGITLAAREALNVKFTVLFGSKMDRNIALTLITSDKPVKDMFDTSNVADTINNNSNKKLAIGLGAVAAAGFLLWKRKKNNDKLEESIKKNETFDEAENYS